MLEPLSRPRGGRATDSANSKLSGTAPPSARRFLQAFALGAAILALLAGTVVTPVSAEEKTAMSTAPDFTGKGIDGKTYALKDLLGKGPVLVNFWATWCGPCMKELPEVQKIWERHREKGFSFVTVAYDDSKSVAKVEPMAKSRGFKFPVILDPDHSISNKYNVRNCPTTYLLDRQGKIVEFAIGYNPGDEKKLEEKIVALLGSGGPAPADTESEGGTR